MNHAAARSRREHQNNPADDAPVPPRAWAGDDRAPCLVAESRTDAARRVADCLVLTLQWDGGPREGSDERRQRMSGIVASASRNPLAQVDHFAAAAVCFADATARWALLLPLAADH